MQPLSLWWSLLMLFPVVTRLLLTLRFWEHAATVLPPQQLDRETHRQYILTLAGFSFTALIAIAVLDKALRQNFSLATLYLLLSFMLFLFAVNLQGYKAHRWQDDLASAATESATLGMILSIVAVLYTGELIAQGGPIIAALGIAIWLLDHMIRLSIEYQYLRKLKPPKTVRVAEPEVPKQAEQPKEPEKPKELKP